MCQHSQIHQLQSGYMQLQSMEQKQRGHLIHLELIGDIARTVTHVHSKKLIIDTQSSVFFYYIHAIFTQNKMQLYF